MVAPARDPARNGMASGLQRRLLVMLLVPLVLLACSTPGLTTARPTAWHCSRTSACSPWCRCWPDSVIAGRQCAGAAGAADGAPGGGVPEFPARPVVALHRGRATAGVLRRGETWLSGVAPTTFEPEFRSEEMEGITYRIVRQRVQTVAGEMVLWAGRWVGSAPAVAAPMLFKVAVAQPGAGCRGIFCGELGGAPALQAADRPEGGGRAPLAARPQRIDEQGSPEEVRPLVQSLNRLFDLVNAQAESQRRFVADAAHQLRTPLAGLQAQVEAWARRPTAKAAEAQPTRYTAARAQVEHRSTSCASATPAHLAAGQPAAGPVACRCPAAMQPSRCSVWTCKSCAKPCWKLIWTPPAPSDVMDLGLDAAARPGHGP
jgi:two-component system sensor histidine kinase TctE